MDISISADITLWQAALCLMGGLIVGLILAGL